MYKEVPEESTGLELQADWCGDEYCNCNRVKIIARMPPKMDWRGELRPFSLELWSSSWYDGYAGLDNKDLGECRRETMEACIHYNLKANLSSSCIWDWE